MAFNGKKCSSRRAQTLWEKLENNYRGLHDAQIISKFEKILNNFKEPKMNLFGAKKN